MTPAAPEEEDKQEPKPAAKITAIAGGKKNIPNTYTCNTPILGKRLHKNVMPAGVKHQPLEDNESADLENNLAGILTAEYLARLERAAKSLPRAFVRKVLGRMRGNIQGVIEAGGYHAKND